MKVSIVFAIGVFFATFAPIIFQAAVSAWEGTFLTQQYRRMPMAFVHNWSISFGDTVFFSLINGLVAPWIHGHSPYVYLICIVIGLVVTITFYRSWWGRDENLGHVFAEWSGHRYESDYWGHPWKNRWAKDTTAAGWINFLFMVFQTAMILLFIVTKMDWPAVVIVSFLFAAFIVLQNAQAYYIQGGYKPKVLIGEIVGIVALTTIKIMIEY